VYLLPASRVRLRGRSGEPGRINALSPIVEGNNISLVLPLGVASCHMRPECNRRPRDQDVLLTKYGQVLGGNANVSTTSGSNQFHGSAFENFQNSYLNSRLQFPSTKPVVANQPVVNAKYQSTLRYLNKAAFTALPISSASGLPIRPGNISGAFVRREGYWNADLSIGRNFLHSREGELQLSLDAFHALNHTSFTSFSHDVLNANFGRFTNARGARVLQLHGRFTF